MKARNGLMGIVLLCASALSLNGCLSTYGKIVARDLAYMGMQQAVVSGVKNSIEGPRGTTVNVTSGVNNVVQQKYYDGKMTDGSYYKGEIETVNNKLHGFGAHTSTNGEKYVGQFKHGIKDGQGTLTGISGQKYVGQFKDDKPHGFGAYTWTDGGKYVGQYKHGIRDGHGTLTGANGEKYVGQFKDGKLDGQGTYTWTNGEKYVGQFKHGIRDGQGTHTCLNGVFVGDWNDDVPYKGKFTGKDGTVLTGVFNCGTKAGTIDYPDGRKYDGEWNGDPKFLGVAETGGKWTFEVPHGVGKMMYPDGKIEEGIWQKGKFLGNSLEKAGLGV